MNSKMMDLFDKKDKLEDKLDKVNLKIIKQIEKITSLDEIEEEMGIAYDDVISDLFYDEIYDRIVVINDNTDALRFCYIDAETLEILPKSDEDDKDYATMTLKIPDDDTIGYVGEILRERLKNLKYKGEWNI